MLLVRIRTVAGKQAVVGRAFNRLVKIAFDEHGIVWRDPTQVVILATPAAAAERPTASEAGPQRRLA